MTLKVLELFSGIGAQAKAIKRLGIDAEFTQCEIDKYAVQSYNAIHGETTNLGDITKVNENDLQEGQWDLITYSSPCQDFSQAGKQKGGEKDSGTRSSLLWEVEKIIRKVRPKYLLLENVKALVGQKFRPLLIEWLKVLDGYGYDNYTQVLNAKDYGIPQNRERVFVISIRRDVSTGLYQFPPKQELKLKLQDLLLDEVEEKYFLSDRTVKTMTNENTGGYNRKEVFLNNINRDIASCITTKAGQRPCDNFIGMYNYTASDKFMGNRERFKKGKEIANTLLTSPKEGVVLKTQLCNKLIEENKVKPYDMISHNYTNNREEKGNAVKDNNISSTLTTRTDCLGVVVPTIEQLRIRKLHPLECFRLMGFDDEDYQKVKAIGMSDAQMYKQCGNSIVVNVLTFIFNELFKNYKKNKQ